MKKGWLCAASVVRYWSAPSVPAESVPWEFMKRPSLSAVPPPASEAS